MRLLAITDDYPPYQRGGLGISAKELLDRLRRRGHSIATVTARPPRGERRRPAHEIDVFRKLAIDDEHAGRAVGIMDEIRDVMFVKRKVDAYGPDLIFIIHICDVAKTMVPYFADCGIPVAYYEGSIGMSFSYNHHGLWHSFAEGRPLTRAKIFLKRILIATCCAVSGGALKKQWAWPENMRGYFNSESGRRLAKAAGMPIEGSKVIHQGLDIELFRYATRTEVSLPPSIVLPGRFEPEKGQRDAVRILAALHRRGINARLMLLGHVEVPSYLYLLEKEVHDLGLTEHVRILPAMVSHEQMPPIYQQADLCFFPSYHKSGMSQVPLEAMASGCVVVSYGNEGSTETIEDGVTGYIIPEGDIEAAANIVSELITRPDTYRGVVQSARAAITSQYSLELYVEKVEAFLLEAVNARQAIPRASLVISA